MKRAILGFAMCVAVAFWGCAVEMNVETAESAIIYTSGYCDGTTNERYVCPLPSRRAICHRNPYHTPGPWAEQVIGCKFPVTGPIGYYALCSLSCSE